MSRLVRFGWKHYYLIVSLGVLGLLATLGGRQGPATASEKPPTVSNHGYMQTTLEGGRVAVLPLRHTAVEAEVVGVMSAVKVTQHFANPYTKPIEATYVFPLPHRAAIHAMTMHVGQRVIRAQIKQRAAARAAYERAKRQGKTASLLEQERPNIFTQSVANILPGESVRVELRYVEELVPEEGRYSFVFPMVVGPRYVGEGATLGRSGSGWAEDNTRVKDASRVTPHHLAPTVRSGRDISLSLRINAGVAIHELRSASHRISLAQPARDMAEIQLDRGDRIPNRDFAVSYRLAGAAPQLAVLASQDPKLGGHFLLMIQPKTRPSAADLAPKEYVFVVDVSGSMEGVPIAQVKAAMQRCLTAMRPDDRFQVIAFAGDAAPLARTPLAPTDKNVSRALAFVEGLDAGGGTEFLPALELALNAPRDPKRSRIVLFMSDGYIGYEAEVLRFLRQHRRGAAVFVLGVGSSVNRYLIDGMARIGGGEPFVLLNREGEAGVVKRFFDTVSRPALTSISVDWGGLAVRDATPGRVPDLFADRPIVLTGRYDRGGAGQVTVRGFLAGAPYEQRVQVALPDSDAGARGTALAYLWARRRIGQWMDIHATDEGAGPVIEKRVTELALRYSLMSKWTAFVAVDQRIRTQGNPAAVPVAAPLPEGVGTGSAPPTAFLGLQGALSTDQFVPGDPEVVIHAPPDAVKVTLIFPTGEVKACARDPRTGAWRASFLVPEDTPDGVYAIQVLITRSGGHQLARTLRYQVDGAEPRVRLRLEPGAARPGQRVRLFLEPETLSLPEPAPRTETDIGDPSFSARVVQEVQRARALLWDGRRLELARRPDGSFEASFDAPEQAGRYEVAVVVRDPARNKLRRVLTLTVAP